MTRTHEMMDDLQKMYPLLHKILLIDQTDTVLMQLQQ